ncbi:MAG: GNAT family N-acetyltransferase [Clostridia bacterium]|nr:GNAT family N-acetyltransferase [Clostridia bacterium]
MNMEFADNILRVYLKNVYFICGTPCGGKTSVSRALGKMYNVPVYDIDERFEAHQQIASPEYQPDMCRQFENADVFFGRSVEEYRGWLLGNRRQQMDFILLDLIRLAEKGRIICDCHMTMDELDRLSDPSRAAFLLRNPVDIVEEYCNRPDHQGFSDFIHSASDYASAAKTCNETLFSLNDGFYRAAKESRYFWLEKDSSRTVEQTAALVAARWGWQKDNALTVRKVEKGTELAARLLGFIENCSWTEAKDHIAENIRTWVFEDWETMFAALDGDEIVGMTSVMKTDYYPLPEIFPWVSCVFVSEKARGKKISGMMIDAANRYLKDLGFEKSYIPSPHTGLYEHYGYRYIRDIVNYGGGTDQLYEKDLK